MAREKVISSLAAASMASAASDDASDSRLILSSVASCQTWVAAIQSSSIKDIVTKKARKGILSTPFNGRLAIE